jgi:hypothetical protein
LNPLHEVDQLAPVGQPRERIGVGQCREALGVVLKGGLDLVGLAGEGDEGEGRGVEDEGLGNDDEPSEERRGGVGLGGDGFAPEEPHRQDAEGGGDRERIGRKAADQASGDQDGDQVADRDGEDQLRKHQGGARRQQKEPTKRSGHHAMAAQRRPHPLIVAIAR